MIKRLGFFTFTIITCFFVFGSEVLAQNTCDGVVTLSQKDDKLNVVGAIGGYKNDAVVRVYFNGSLVQGVAPQNLQEVSGKPGYYSFNYTINPTKGDGSYYVDLIAPPSCGTISSSGVVQFVRQQVTTPNTGVIDCNNDVVSNVWLDVSDATIPPKLYLLTKSSYTGGLPFFTVKVKKNGSYIGGNFSITPKTGGGLSSSAVILSGSGSYQFDLSSPLCTNIVSSGITNFTAIQENQPCNKDNDACETGYACTRTSDCSSFQNGQCAPGGYYCMLAGTPGGSLTPNPVNLLPFSTPPLNIPELIKVIIKFSIGIAGVAAFFLLAIGSYKFMLSSGDPAAIQSAQETISSAIAGLVLIILAVSIFGIMSGILQIPGISLNGTDITVPDLTPGN